MFPGMRRQDQGTTFFLLLLVALFSARAAIAYECITPLAWANKLDSPARDANANYVEDSIDALASNIVIDVEVLLNRCPTSADLSAFGALATVDRVGKYVSSVGLQGITVADAISLASMASVAFVEMPPAPVLALDVSGQTVRVRTTTETTGTVEQQYPGLTGAGVQVAIIDSGVDNTVHETFLPPRPFVDGLLANGSMGDPAPSGPHGTMVAGVAIGDDATYRGMAPGADLLDVDYQMGIFQAMAEIGSLADAGTWSPGVVNWSSMYADCLNDDGTSAGPMLVNSLVARDIAFVAAVGQGTACATPLPDGSNVIQGLAAADGAIVVAAVDEMGDPAWGNDVIWPPSFRGPRISDNDLDSTDELKPDIAAPGVAIHSATIASSTSFGNGTGTSFAAPHVTGCIALIRDAYPNVNVKSIREALIHTAQNYPNWSADVGYGMMDCYSAIEYLSPANAVTDLQFEYYVCRPGDAPPCWESPNIQPDTFDIVQGDQMDVTVEIWNSGSQAISNFDVEIGLHVFGNSQMTETICRVTVTQVIAAGQMADVTCSWMVPVIPNSTDPVHACLKAEIIYAQDEDPDNNKAQHNVMLKPTGSPATFPMQVVNPTGQDLVMELQATVIGACPWDLDHDGTVGASDYAILLPLFQAGTPCHPKDLACLGDFDGDFDRTSADVADLVAHIGSCPDDWIFSASDNDFVLAADDCPRVVELYLDPDVSLAPQALARIAVYGTPTGGGSPMALGGVTIIGVKANGVPLLPWPWAGAVLAITLLGTTALWRRRQARGGM